VSFIRRISSLLLAVMLAGGIVSSCAPQEPQREMVLSLKKLEVSNESGTMTVEAGAQGDWTLSVAQDTVSWVSLHYFGEASSQSLEGSGFDSNRIIVLDYSQNSSASQRSCTITLSCNGLIKTQTLVQEKGNVYEPGPQGLFSDAVPQWMELPAVPQREGYYYIIPYSLKNHTERNYSYYWDLGSMVALWVAYPLCNSYLQDKNGNTVGRSEAWALDQRLPQDAQPSLVNRSYQNASGNWSGYARGHQLPSGDRQSNIYQNMETFYGVNMTPQDYDFNGTIWASLESNVRSWGAEFDTLYVVTGCIVEGSKTVVYDERSGSSRVEIKVPTGYFKALLGYAGASASKRKEFSSLSETGYYSAVAYVFENRAYSHRDYKKCMVSIDELEKITGFDFFVNLPDQYESIIEKDINSIWK